MDGDRIKFNISLFNLLYKHERLCERKRVLIKTLREPLVSTAGEQVAPTGLIILVDLQLLTDSSYGAFVS